MPFDPNISNKEQEKVKKYERLAAEVSRMHRVGTHVVPIVVSALGVVVEAVRDWRWCW